VIKENKVKKTMRAVALALALSGAVVSLPACATVSGVFESDPVGASLVTIKASYEASVRTAGRLYIQGLITEAQLRRFRDEANKFFVTYNKVVTAHAEAKLSTDDARVKNLKLSLTALEALVVSLSS
jgi:hypothetical protein